MDTPLLLTAKVAASACIGILIGLERTWAHKDAGVRSFTIATLLGTLSWLVTPTLAYTQVGIVLMVLLLVNGYAIWNKRSLEITTSLALAAANVLGIVTGTGNFFLAIASALVVTALLSWKTELITFSSKLTVVEIRSTLLFGFITAVIYPLLPDRFIDPWRLLNPRSVWLTVVIVSGLSFVNYVLLRQFGTRGIRYSAVLGGFVNSAATAALIGQEARDDPSTLAAAPTNAVLSDYDFTQLGIGRYLHLPTRHSGQHQHRDRIGANDAGSWDYALFALLGSRKSKLKTFTVLSKSLSRSGGSRLLLSYVQY